MKVSTKVIHQTDMPTKFSISIFTEPETIMKCDIDGVAGMYTAKADQRIVRDTTDCGAPITKTGFVRIIKNL